MPDWHPSSQNLTNNSVSEFLELHDNIDYLPAPCRIHISLCSGMLQIAFAGQLPNLLIPAITAGAALTAVMMTARIFSSRHVITMQAWHAWQALTAIVGIVIVPQVLSGTFFGVQSLWPAAISAVPGSSPFRCFNPHVLAKL
jgi:hypothetical protein